jgi:hypothetical protein
MKVKIYKKLRNIGYIKKQVDLPFLNTSIDIQYHDKLLNAKIPSKYQDFINKQLIYIDNLKDFDLIELVVKYSMKMFNLYLTKNLVMREHMWKIIFNRYKTNSYIYIINKINDMILNAPAPSKTIVVYHGARDDLLNLYIKNKTWIPNKFVSGTFDKLHAGNYANLRQREHITGTKASLIKILIPKNTKCLFHPYENQLIFPFNTKFKIIYKKKAVIKYKDIIQDNIPENIRSISGYYIKMIAYN